MTPNPLASPDETTTDHRLVRVEFEWRTIIVPSNCVTLYCGGYRKGRIEFQPAYTTINRPPFDDRWYVYLKRRSHEELLTSVHATNGGSLESAKAFLIDAAVKEFGAVEAVENGD